MVALTNSSIYFALIRKGGYATIIGSADTNSRLPRKRRKSVKEIKNRNKIVVRGVGAVSSLALSLSLLISPSAARAEGRYIESKSEAYSLSELAERDSRVRKINYNLPGVSSLSISSYERRTLSVNGKRLSDPAIIINETVYVPLKEFINAVTASTHSYSGGTSTVRASGLVISAANGGYVIYANDRPLFSFSPTVRMSNGTVYVPASALERATGIKRWTVASDRITFGGTYSPLLHASKFYREDEVFWLSKIISAESAGESLLGQIAVGDVIMNRVKSNQYPNTIYGVIFDRKWGVQFSPTADGRIHNSPTYSATLAAKICLEGVSLSDNAIYFLNPKAAASNWIVNNRRYLYTIGNHDFYD